MRTTSVEQNIRQKIALKGQIDFADFMEIALYGNPDGYYKQKNPIGSSGDYYTSPIAHPVFGALLCFQLYYMWETLERPDPFHVIELGSADYCLARDILEFSKQLPNQFCETLEYIAMDRAIPYRPGINIQGILTNEMPLNLETCVIISNELLDAFPVNRFKIVNGTVQELFITLDENNVLCFKPDVPTSPKLIESLGCVVTDLPEGYESEINLYLEPWLEKLSNSFQRGFILTIDYGYEGNQLYSLDRNRGTIQTYYNHSNGDNPLSRIGSQDITSHVNFSLLRTLGCKFGLEPIATLTQADYLTKLGMNQFISNLRTLSLSTHDNQANLMAMKNLIDPFGLGKFKVMIQQKNILNIDARSILPSVGALIEYATPLLGKSNIRLAEAKYPHTFGPN